MLTVVPDSASEGDDRPAVGEVSLIDQIVRDGARRMLAEALRADGRGGHAGQAVPGRQGRPGLETAAMAGRFAENDLIRILAPSDRRGQVEPTRAGEAHSLQPGTSAWSSFGTITEGDEA